MTMAFRSKAEKDESKAKGRQNSIRRLQEEAAAHADRHPDYAATRQAQAEAMCQSPHPHS
jgi:hypothetical protein